MFCLNPARDPKDFLNCADFCITSHEALCVASVNAFPTLCVGNASPSVGVTLTGLSMEGCAGPIWNILEVAGVWEG